MSTAQTVGNRLGQVPANGAIATCVKGITATASGTQATSIALADGINQIDTVTTTADGVLLPPAGPGKGVYVVNNGANSMTVFARTPPTNINGVAGVVDTISGTAGSTGVAQAAGAVALYLCTYFDPSGATANQWWQITSVALGGAGSFTTLAASSTLAVTGATTLSSTLAVTGALTPTGGIVTTTKTRIPDIAIGGVAYGSLGTDTTPSATTLYVTEVEIPFNKTITGIALLNGSVAGTDKYVLALYASAGGAALASSALAGTLASGSANSFQEIALTAPYAAVGGRYWIALQVNGTTTRFRTIAASTYLNLTKGQTASTFGTLPSLTIPTTTTADVGPIAYLYT